ncbi:MAG: HlyC/CorC family transporter [Chloroflexi bacterium]|nr:HlyC/CorC family transporter [Chloroflexota bacterium]
MGWLVFLAILAILILINALFVAAEFATASSRRSRLANMVAEGNSVAGRVLHILESPERLDNYIATCQLGITASSLILGFYGQSTLSGLLRPYMDDVFGAGNLVAQSISAAVILLLLTVLQVLLGELVPKNIGIRYPEKLAQFTFLPIRWSMLLMRPFIIIFNGSARLILRLFGHKATSEHAHVHASDEILLLVEESGAGGIIDFEERVMLENALQLRERVVRQVMVPRTKMFAASVEQPCDELFKLLAESSYSRLPLYEEDVDSTVGVVHLKDLLKASWSSIPCSDFRKVMKPAYYIPEALPIAQAFRQMQRSGQHLAIIIDEYGGTAGMLTLEDMIEEVFGDIQDEFDREVPHIREEEGRILIDGDTDIDEINARFNFTLPENSATTLGGLIVSELGYIPTVGEIVVLDGVQVRIERMEGNWIALVSMDRHTTVLMGAQNE